MNEDETTTAGARTQTIERTPEDIKQADAFFATREGQELRTGMVNYWGARFTHGYPEQDTLITVPDTGNAQANTHLLWQRARKFLSNVSLAKNCSPGWTPERDQFPRQPEFLVRNRWRKNTVTQMTTIKATFPEYDRPAKRQPFPNFATLVEGTGRYNKKRFNLRADSTNSVTLAAKQPEVKECIRRLRSDEEELLCKVEEQIALARAVVDELQARKNDILKQGFAKGHVVHLGELKSAAQAALDAKLARLASKTVAFDKAAEKAGFTKGGAK